jgi:protein-S-isoprenylcysteine O-methyltransferase Ste14
MKTAVISTHIDASAGSVSTLLRSPTLNLAVGLLLGGVWGYFAFRHIAAFHAHGIWGHLLYGIVETLIAAFFITRPAPQTVSTRPLDWLVAFVGSFAPSFFTPGTWGLVPSADKLLYVGLVLQLTALVFLNRSFGIVPAKRRIKTAGAYALVRHPMYASHVFAMTGYVLTNTSTANCIVFAIVAVCMYARMLREEAHLALDPLYRQYMQRVRYRLLPFVF